VTNSQIELYNTDGSQGAARGAGYGAGIYKHIQDCFVGLEAVDTIDPVESDRTAYQDAYQHWLKALAKYC
jgi:xylulokinase